LDPVVEWLRSMFFWILGALGTWVAFVMVTLYRHGTKIEVLENTFTQSLDEFKEELAKAQAEIDERHAQNREDAAAQHSAFMAKVEALAGEAKEDRHYLVGLMQANVNRQAETNSSVAQQIGRLSGVIEKIGR
jgi:hypothetical protein